MTGWETTWIVGNGPSGRDFDATGRTGRILALNDAFHRLRARGVGCSVFSLDGGWVSANRAFLESYPGDRFIALPLETFPQCAGIPGVNYLKWSYKSFSDDPDTVATGCNSGYAAINLAALRGAKTIHLIGYDMDPKDNPQYQFWGPNFRNLVPYLAERCIEVWNHNRASYVDAFPKCAMNYKGA